VALASAATARGRQNFNDAQLANEQLVAVLNNNTPAGLGTPDPSASREETADRAALMARMQVAFDRLKEAGADAAALRKNAATAAHEARILAALMKFTSLADYASAEEPDYQAASGEILASGAAMAEAVAAEDHSGFQAALGRVSTACNRCHEKFRFER
jgi:cytochrome c556